MKNESKHESERAPLYKRIFPWRGDSVREAVRKTALLFFCAVFAVSAWKLADATLIQPKIASQEADEIRDLYYGDQAFSEPLAWEDEVSEEPPSQSSADVSQVESSAAASTASSSTPAPPPEPKLSFEEIKKINSDIVGWINFPRMGIDYPVLQSAKDEPEYYLKRNYKKNYSDHGSIFLNSHSDIASSKNLILYGHSMNDGSMFAPLLKYTPSVYKKAPILNFDIDGQAGQWKVISIFKTNTLSSQGPVFNFLQTDFKNDNDYMNFIYQLRIRSLVNAPVDFIPSDRIVMLSTCSYEFDEFRTVLVARQVREGESPSVDVSKSKQNSKVLYPDCWYKKNGSTKPEWPATFQEALNQGLLDWVGVYS